jgi:exodeoxyribonuclease V alpha subunit
MKRAGLEAPDLGIATGFARYAERWALALGAPESTARAVHDAAHAVSVATSSGHVCVALRDLAGDDAAALREALLASGVVGTPQARGSAPLILDGDGRLYLHRYFDYERRLAARLRLAQQGGAAPRVASPLLATLFAGNAAQLAGEPDWQRIAVALALRGRLTVISGGPGTGKTTTVVNLLACLIDQDPACRIALAAPTGKAAARMTDAIRERAVHLPEAIRSRLPGEAFTIHRLLGVTPRGFVHHAGNPLAIDALVVDEASMLDLALATQLLEAVPASARIVLLGDKDQLAAVESGAVFAELSADPSLTDACRDDLAALCGLTPARIVPPAATEPSASRDAVVWLRHNFRFAPGSGLAELAALVQRGDAEDTLAWLSAAGEGGVRWFADASAPAVADHAFAGYAPLLAALRSGAGIAECSAAFARFRVLCAVRDGPRGVDAVNAEVTRRFREALGAQGGDERSPWYSGRPVLVLRNDPVLKLFNGDIGIALPDASGALSVYFAQADGGFRAVAPLRLPVHETAFAMTVHKSQGSEFDRVLVLLPAQKSRVLTRELTYTAITRARDSVSLFAGAPVLGGAIANSTRRHSGLLARLRETEEQTP